MEFSLEILSTVQTPTSLEITSPTGVRLASVNTSACESDIMAESPLRYRNDRNKVVKLILKQSRDIDRRLNGLITKNTSKLSYSQFYRETDKLTDKEDVDDSDPCFNESSHMRPIGFKAFEKRYAKSPLGFMKTGKLSIDIHLGSDSKSRPGSSFENTFKVKSSSKHFMRSRYTPQNLTTDSRWTDSISKQEASGSRQLLWNEDFTTNSRSPSKKPDRSVSVNRSIIPETIGISKRNTSAHPYRRRVKKYFSKLTADQIKHEMDSAIKKSKKKKSTSNIWKLSHNQIEGKAIFDAMDLVSKCNSYKLSGFRFNNKC